MSEQNLNIYDIGNYGIAILESELTALGAALARVTAERDTWRAFAEHQEICADCAESVSGCTAGTKLKNVALAADGAVGKGE